eukprot:979390-Pelagomonas_calceolata.AAC.6
MSRAAGKTIPRGDIGNKASTCCAGITSLWTCDKTYQGTHQTSRGLYTLLKAKRPFLVLLKKV